MLVIVSDPSHRRYGKHLTTDEINELVKPSNSALFAVHEWLADHGIDLDELDYTPAKDWIKVRLPVSTVEDLLDTKYSTYQHEDGSYVVRTPEWSLPAHLHEHIDTIQPTNSFFRAKARRSTVKPIGKARPAARYGHAVSLNKAAAAGKLTPAQACNASAVTPLCLRTLYGTVDYVPQVPGENKVGLNDFLGEINNKSDAYLFLSQFRPDALSEAYSFKQVSIDGGTLQQTPLNASQLNAGTGFEGNLDAETILGIDYPTPLTAFSTGGSPPFNPDDNTPTDTNEPYLAWVQYALSAQDIPQVISTSYGDDEQTVPLSYAQAVCNSFAQLGARGVSLLFASGDDGVGANGTCFSNDGKNTSTFLPSFPDGCPYVTSVGGTKNINPEVVAYDAENGYAGGGGFSNYFARPAYQDAVVTNYLSEIGDEFAGLYNQSGRAYPDIAAQSYRYIVTYDGENVFLDGTSAATPTASAVIALVNDALLAAGKPVLGFLNPWLYSKGYTAFTDILSGSAIGCDTAGFPALAGWDAVTGFGTPVSQAPFFITDLPINNC